MTVKILFTERVQTLMGRLGEQEMLCRYRGGVLRITHRKIWKRRHIDVAEIIAEAIAQSGRRRLPPFFVNLSDTPMVRRPRRITRFASASAAGSDDVAAPDFSFGSWPEAQYDDFDRKAAEIATAGLAPPIDDRAIWRGRDNNIWRTAFLRVASERPDLIDAQDLNRNFDHDGHRYQSGFTPMEDQVRSHRYLIDIEGAGYSGRFKLLLHSGRAMLLQSHPWREWFVDDLQPFRHFVPVARDFSDLVQQLEWLRAHPEREAEIAAEAKRFAQSRLTRAAAIADWAALLEAHVAAHGRLRSGLGHLPVQI